ncbi:MAG: xanthine dehydrogenase family protein molybdopterin-binding subunit [Deltaproteobacteria bacterium]
MTSQINKSIPRIGAVDFARGCRLFSEDISLDNALSLHVFRSTKAHARILRLDVEEARRVKGVVGVLTAGDIPGKNLFGLINKDQPLLAHEKVRFEGEAIALVAAVDKEAGHRALNAIKVAYEDLPAVLGPHEAMKENAPLVHAKGNLLSRRVVRKGDAEAALSRCDIVIKKTYRTPHVEHCYLEPDAGVGFIDEDGTLIIYASTQNPHYDLKEVSEILGLPEEHLRIVQAATGGGFGSKLDLTVQGFIGLALHLFRRPVQLAFTREEAFLATPKRHPMTIEMETGAAKDGKIHALRARIVCDTGAYASYGLAVATRAALHATGPYEIENVDVESLCVYTNNPIGGAMRGFGVPQVAFAHESQMNLLAQELRLDPLEIRRINALRVGSKTGTGQELAASVGIVKTLEAIEPYYRQAKAQWRTESPAAPLKRGIGIGSMWYGIGNTGVQNPSSARVEMDGLGRITLFSGVADIGQGSSTVLAQIAAEMLGIEPSEIRLVIGDTGCTTNAGATSASRQTYISGNAVKEATAKLADVLLTEAVDVLKTPKSLLVLEDGFVVDSRHSDRRVSLSKLAKRAHDRGRPLTWQGYFDPETTPLDGETGQGVPYATYAFASHLALATVDSSTGEVRVNRIVAAHDVGKAVNPQNVEGQIQGGVGMGLGFALMEEFIPGKTASMGDYHIPTSLDMPEVVPLIVEDLEPTGPYGAKGVGEPALIPTAPAILNAIADALGERIYRLPAHPERVRKAARRRIVSCP